jgi:hypothetical protein
MGLPQKVLAEESADRVSVSVAVILCTSAGQLKVSASRFRVHVVQFDRFSNYTFSRGTKH